MSTITFDTFKFVDRLEKAGMSREQASAIVDAQQQSLAESLDNTLAKKSDVRELKYEMQAMELRLTIKLGAFIAAAVGIIIAVLRVSH